MNWNRELVREPVVEGIFYPEDPQELRSLISRSLLGARTVASRPGGIIVPNAAIEFLAPVSAEAYKRCLGNEYRRAVIMGMQQNGEESGFLLPESTIFRTPVGSLQVDSEALELIHSGSTLSRISEVVHLQEHCIEVQLPWIQHLWPEILIVPLIIGPLGMAEVTALASTLRILLEELDGETLLIASVNLSPALPRETAAAQSGLFLELLLENRWKELVEARKGRRLTGPGTSAAAVMSALLGEDCLLELVRRGSSFEYDKNDTSVVEYAAVSFERPLVSGGI